MDRKGMPGSVFWRGRKVQITVVFPSRFNAKSHLLDPTGHLLIFDFLDCCFRKFFTWGLGSPSQCQAMLFEGPFKLQALGEPQTNNLQLSFHHPKKRGWGTCHDIPVVKMMAASGTNQTPLWTTTRIHLLWFGLTLREVDMRVNSDKPFIMPIYFLFTAKQQSCFKNQWPRFR